ncbi:transposase [Bathymodiolus japonicus methanotrophic gill symbiont]|uniref:transposase n=1 Tax=Bathymodiolus japonicus methanotrophic gill symbiont TaxID=113269 RepID=UPI0021E19578|nr:transposase [Bathymodiolus japonicus methanotrophic gill symbiont]
MCSVCGGRRAAGASPIRCVGERITATGVPEFREVAWRACNACILSDAFGIGIEKMAEMSDLNYNLMRSTHEDFMRIETLCAANDMVGNLIHSLPIFKLWNIMDDKMLADADGLKISN